MGFHLCYHNEQVSEHLQKIRWSFYSLKLSMWMRKSTIPINQKGRHYWGKLIWLLFRWTHSVMVDSMISCHITFNVPRTVLCYLSNFMLILQLYSVYVLRLMSLGCESVPGVIIFNKNLKPGQWCSASSLDDRKTAAATQCDWQPLEAVIILCL